MKQIIILAFLAVAAFATNSCTIYHTAADGTFYKIPGGVFNGTDQSGFSWYFSTCPQSSVHAHGDSPCGLNRDRKSVAVCQEIKDIYYAKGLDVVKNIGDSPYGAKKGIEIVYGTTNPTFKTVVELVCSEQNEDDIVTVKAVDDTMAVITHTSVNNCPVELVPNVAVDPDVDENEERTIVIPGAFIYFSFLCVSLLCVCCCCTCMMRRRRTQQRKDIQMKQFSSVAFQPIPANTAAKNATTAPQAAYNPYIAQPQFVYYYPSQNGAAVPEYNIPFAQYAANEEHTNNDENIARNLQAQFDRENV